MFLRSLILIGLVCSLFQLSACTVKETNASRMKRGLPPLRPAALSREKNRGTASTTVSSPPVYATAPSDSYRIEVQAKDGRLLGSVGDSVPLGINRRTVKHDMRVKVVTRGDHFHVIVGQCFLGAYADNRNLAISCTESTRWSSHPVTGELQALLDNKRSPAIMVYDAQENKLRFLKDGDSIRVELALIPVELYLRND